LDNHDDWTYFDWEALVGTLRVLGDKQQSSRGFPGTPVVGGHTRLRWFCQQWQDLVPACPGPSEALGLLSTHPPEAIGPLTKALQLAPSLRWARFHRGKMHAKLSSYRESI